MAVAVVDAAYQAKISRLQQGIGKEGIGHRDVRRGLNADVKFPCGKILNVVRVIERVVERGSDV